jgi:hypothetical protein
VTITEESAQPNVEKLKKPMQTCGTNISCKYTVDAGQAKVCNNTECNKILLLTGLTGRFMLKE